MSKQSRTYSGIEYSRCESMQSLIKALNEVTKEDGMEFELLRREATEPIYLREYPVNNVREERQ